METKKAINFACEACRDGKRKGKQCVYVTEEKPKRRKYWDEEYVHSLENQVKTLLAALEASSTSPKTSVPSAPRAIPVIPAIPVTAPHDGSASAEDRSITAMEELSVMMWRTNIGDGVTIINDSATGSGSRRVDSSEPARCEDEQVQPPERIVEYCRDRTLIHGLADLFLDNINGEHQFTGYTSSDFLVGYPQNQNLGHTLLHSAILATGAVFSGRPDAAEISEAFARFAESLVFSCFRSSLGVQVLQGLCILSWRSLALGRDHFGWTFISMAAGLCVHLRLHVLALDECAARAWQPQDSEIRTFWMFYLIDRTAISILGRNCVLPWRRVNVPRFDDTLNPLSATDAQIAFTWQCRLWFLHDEHMDQIFASNFDSMPAQQQVHLLVSTHEALNGFFHARDRRLDLQGRGTSRHVLFFHMAYQMALLITLPPFLRCFCRPGAPSDSDYSLLILRSLTSAASTMVRLVRMYRDAHPARWARANPVIIHHLLSAAIVHMMNATSQSPSLKSRSAVWLRLCMEMLGQLRAPWPTRANKTIYVIRVLAERWHVLGALPVQFSSKVGTGAVDTALSPSSSLLAEDLPSTAQLEVPSSNSAFPDFDLVGHEALDFGVDFSVGGHQRFDDYLSLDNTVQWHTGDDAIPSYFDFAP
ncbi:hypothetical protein SEUCBS139899_008255 [Sporothrix eucalyptigena]